MLVGEGELGEGGAQVPGEVAGEHADQDVAAASWPAGQLEALFAGGWESVRKIVRGVIDENVSAGHMG